MSTDLIFENARLQGRVITLEALLESERAEVARLKAEVERMTKTADLICRMSGDNQVIKSYWKHAKKGGHS